MVDQLLFCQRADLQHPSDYPLVLVRLFLLEIPTQILPVTPIQILPMTPTLLTLAAPEHHSNR